MNVHKARAPLDEMFYTGKYKPPSPYDDLPGGLEFALKWLKIGPMTNATAAELDWYDHLRLWAHDAQALLGHLSPLVQPKTGKLPPMNCTKCNYHNEYVGQEHLVNGVYTCRSCR